jgi:hypothetical protein
VLDSLDARQFEFAARDIVQFLDPNFTDLHVTRATRDGGRDVVARYRIGRAGHQVVLEACVEAKHWDPKRAIGVKPVMRLLSRLKHRDIGVFVTTAFFDRQVQEELLEDRHPVILVSGGDVARLLIDRDMADATPERLLDAWLGSVRARAAGR